MTASLYSPRWVWWGPADARSELRVLKAHVYDPSGSSARVIWSLEHVCQAIPAATHGRVTKWLQRAGAPSSRHKFCMQHGLCEFDWLPSLLSKDGRDAAKRDRSLRAGDDARCGTKYLSSVRHQAVIRQSSVSHRVALLVHHYSLIVHNYCRYL